MGVAINHSTSLDVLLCEILSLSSGICVHRGVTKNLGHWDPDHLIGATRFNSVYPLPRILSSLAAGTEIEGPMSKGMTSLSLWGSERRTKDKAGDFGQVMGYWHQRTDETEQPSPHVKQAPLVFNG